MMMMMMMMMIVSAEICFLVQSKGSWFYFHLTNKEA